MLPAAVLVALAVSLAWALARADGSDVAGDAPSSTTAAAVNDVPGDVVSLTAAVEAGLDDADELANGTVRRSAGHLSLGSHARVPTIVGVRFRELAIPQGVTILRAHVEFTLAAPGDGAAFLLVAAEAADDSAPFTSAEFDLSSRRRTNAAVEGAPPQRPAGVIGSRRRTPNLAAVLQEIVDRPGWAAGNAISVLVTGSGRERAVSFESRFPPVLRIEFATAAAAPPQNRAPPTIGGRAEVGHVLTADPGSWTDDGPISYAYQWQRCDPAGASCADIARAQAITHAVDDSDVGATLRVRVIGSNRDRAAEVLTRPTSVVLSAAADGLSEVADSSTGSSDPTYYALNHRIAVTASGRQLVLHGRHGSGVRLTWRDPLGSWRRATRGAVSEGRVLRGTGTGDWSASIAVARAPDGEEHAWIVWGAASTGETTKPLELRRLSALDHPEGPVVGPIVVLDSASSGPARPDLAFERAPDGSFRGCVVWTRLDGGRNHLVAAWFSDLSIDTPALHDHVSLMASSSPSRNATIIGTAAGVGVVARSSRMNRLQLFRHDRTAPLSTWSAGSAGVSTSSEAMPSAVGLASGAVVAAVDSDTSADVVTVQRFGASPRPTVDLELRGYSMPSLASVGRRLWLVMIRSSDGHVVSRSFAPATGWSQDDRIEIGSEGGGNYAWPNLLREAADRLSFIVRGRSSTGRRSAVLAFQRPA